MANETFDLSDLDISAASEAGVVVEIVRPGSAGPIMTPDGPMSVTVAGEQSERFQKARRSAANRRLAMKGRSKLTIEELEEEALDSLCKCVLAWNGFYKAGVQLASDYTNVRAILANPGYVWLRKQIDEAVGDEANFIKK